MIFFENALKILKLMTPPLCTTWCRYACWKKVYAQQALKITPVVVEYLKILEQK